MQILYRDNDIAVCIKPVGMDSETEVPAALAEALEGTFFTLHRLDKNVGGVMVYARSKTAAAALSKTIQEGAMIKEYIAQISGQPPQEGDWTDLLWKDSSKNKVFVVKRERRGVKKARLIYRRIGEGLVHIRLYTGRSHQIRVQFASRGFPLLGDHKYGARDAFTAPRLFSCRITFPYRGKMHRYEALPDWAEGAQLVQFSQSEGV